MLHYALCLPDYTWGISFRYFYNILRKTLTNWNLSSREQEGEKIRKQYMEQVELFGLEKKLPEHTGTISLKC